MSKSRRLSHEQHAPAAAIEGASVEIVFEATGRHLDAKKELFEAWINDFRSCRYWQNFEDIAADIVVFAMASGRTVDRAELGNRAVSALLRGAASKYPGRVALTGSATTITSSVAEGLSVSDVKGIFASHHSIEVVCKRTAATRKEALKRLKSEDKRDPPEAAASAAENSPAAQVATGSRVFKFSSQYELAVQEYALLTGVSSKKLGQDGSR